MIKCNRDIGLRWGLSMNRTVATNDPRNGIRYWSNAAFWLERNFLRNCLNGHSALSLQNSWKRCAKSMWWSLGSGKYCLFSSQPSKNYRNILQFFFLLKSTLLHPREHISVGIYRHETASITIHIQIFDWNFHNFIGIGENIEAAYGCIDRLGDSLSQMQHFLEWIVAFFGCHMHTIFERKKTNDSDIAYTMNTLFVVEVVVI